MTTEFSGTADAPAAPGHDARFRRLIEDSAIATNLLTPDGRFAVVNPAMCTMLGYDADALLRMNWRDLTAPEYVADGTRAVEDLLAGRQDSVRLTKEYVHADGHRVWGELTLGCMRDSSGTVECLIAQIADITDREALRSKQADADARFRRMMENSSVGMSLNAPDGRFVDVNDAICEMLGYDAETLCGMTWQQVTAPASLEVDVRQTNDLAAGVIDNYRTKKQFIHADGHLIWTDLSASCIRRPDGELELFVAQFIDVTTEVELRARQAESDALFRRLMENSNVAMAMATVDGRFDVINQAMCEFLGYDEATLTTKSWQDVTPADYLGADLRNVEDLIAGRLDTYRVTKPFVHAGGHLVWADLSVSCLRNTTGAVQYLVAQSVDISDEVAARALLAQREQENRVLADLLKAEIRSAADYVESTLPADLHGTVEAASRYLPSLALGGDRFHYRWIDDDHLKVYLLDVSGHGVRPAFLSMAVHNFIRSGTLSTTTLLDPGRVLARLNAVFPMEEQGGHYFTIWYGIYQPSTRTLRYGSAGHPPALALARDDGRVTASRLRTTDCPIGLFADTVFASASYSVPSGGQLLLYSDGAFELPLDRLNRQPLLLADFIALCVETAARPGWSLDELVERLRALSPTGDFDDDCSLVRLTFP